LSERFEEALNSSINVNDLLTTSQSG